MKTLILSILIIFILFCIYLLFRNAMTFAMLHSVCEAMRNYLWSEEFDQLMKSENKETFQKELEKIDHIITKHKYERILFSFFTPIRLNKWYTPEEVELIQRYWKS